MAPTLGNKQSRTSTRLSVSHAHRSFKVCEISTSLQTGVQGFLLCSHDDFVASGSPIVVHLGRDAVSLGQSPPLHNARYIYDIGLQDLLDHAEDEEGDGLAEEEHKGLAEKGAAKHRDPDDGDQDAQRMGVARRQGRERGVDLLLRTSTRPRLIRNIPPLSGRWLAAIMVLLLVYFVGSRFRRHTIVKPLDPSPEVAHPDLMRRHLAVPKAIMDSGALDSKLYNQLMTDVEEYC